MAMIFRLPAQALRTRITLVLPAEQPDGMGGRTRVWSDGETRWAHILPQATTDSGGRTPTNMRIRVIMRNTPGLLQLPLRLKWRGAIYRCVQAHEMPEHALQQLICEKII